jgi:hypothetical protein
MRFVLSAFRLLVTVVAIALGVEGGYRLYLYFKHPDYFTTTAIDASDFSVLNKSLWTYDPDYGYAYVPSLKVEGVELKGGMVTRCAELAVANEQGNLGPPTPDFDAAQLRIVVFGDSFSGAEVTGPAWTKMLGHKLESEIGRTVRVLNLARDGYGLPQMVTLAACRMRELRPSLVIFAFHGSAFNRAKTWRTAVGSGDEVRLYTSTENSPTPDPETAADTLLVMPSVTKSWCEEHLRKPTEERRSDPLLQKIVVKHREVAIKNGSPQADLLDLEASYVYGLLRYRSPFRAQWRRMKPSTNPELPYDDYRDDARFMADLANVMKSGVPYLFAHLALGKSISEGREFDLDIRGRKLMQSLRDITGSEVHRTTDFAFPSREDALKMCKSPQDCHPSEFGMAVYAQAVAKMVLKDGIR